MKIFHRLSLTYIGIALMIGVIGLVAVSASQHALRQAIGESSARLAIQILDQIDRNLQKHVEESQVLAHDPHLERAADESNRQFAEMEDPAEYIDRVDREWTSKSSESDLPLVKRLLNHPCSQGFRERLKFYHAKYGKRTIGEIFATNRYGANIAMSKRTTDFRQDDEPWWQHARDSGVFVADVEYDRSADVYSTDIAVRIESASAEFLGVLKLVLNIEDLIGIIEEAEHVKPSTESPLTITLLNAQGKVIYSTARLDIFDDFADAVRHVGDPDDPRGVVRRNHEGVWVLSVQARSQGYRDFPGLGWVLVLEQPTDRLFQPVKGLRGQILIIGAGLILAAVIMGWLTSISISRPISRLERGTEVIAAGDLDHHVGTPAADEIGQLGRSFDRMTAQLKQTTVSRDKLAAEVEERRRAEHRLEQVLEELRRSNRELEQFAYVASHDLQEPLRMVKSYTELLGKRYEGQLDEKADQFIGFAVEGAQRMQQMVDDLLALSRVGSRGRPFDPADFENILAKAKTNLAFAIKDSGAAITHSSLPTLSVDAAQMAQLFQNLLGNAIKFRGDEAPNVRIAALQEDHNWVFSVADNGIGIEPQYMDKIFVIFKRLHDRAKYPGNGIGLAICRKIVERHGGRIWAESEPGKGTTFYFTVPESSGQIPPRQEAQTPES